MSFVEGEKVVVKHQRELGEFVVTNPRDETVIKRIGGESVGHYVRIGKDNLGYHEASLEKA